MSHDTVDPQLLRRLWEEGKFDEGAAQLTGIDLNAELAPIFLHYAGLCLAGVGQERTAIDLLKRAASSGYSRFYSAYHLAHGELRSGNPAHAAYYFTVSLISDPARDEILPALENLVGDIYLAPLRTAQAGTASPAVAGETFVTGVAMEEAGQATAAVYYFTTALALDPEHSEARDRLLRLVPDVSLEVLTGIEKGWLAAELGDRPGEPMQRDTARRETARVDAKMLRRLWEEGKFAEGAALLDGIDLNADLAPDVLHYAGLCLAGVGEERVAIDLLKRAASGGYSRFYSAYHLAHGELRSGNTAQAAYYFTVSLIADPARADVLPSLENLAPGLDLAPLRAAQAGTASADRAHEVFALGLERQEAGKSEAAVYYFTIALALDPALQEARDRLMQLARDISIEVLTGADMDRIAAELHARLNEPGSDEPAVERRLAAAAGVHAIYTQSWHRSGQALIPALESVLHSALAAPNVALDPLCLLYDALFSLYFYMSPHRSDMRGFADGVVRPFATAIRDGSICRALPPVARRSLGSEPLRLAYLAQYALGPGNAVGQFAHHLLGGLSRHFPQCYRTALYAWSEYDDSSLASLEGDDVLVRRFTGNSMSERLAAVAEAIAADEIDILITDQNSWLPTVLFERRVAPVQIYYMVGGLSFWPLQNIDAVFRIDVDAPELDGFNAGQCFPTGLGPWDLTALAPQIDPARIALQRARFPQGVRLIGNYGRLAKVTPEFLSLLGELAARHADLVIVLGGSGDAGWIREFIAKHGLTGRLQVVEEFVDGHVWGYMLELFVDTFPSEGGVSRREVMAKGRPVVTMLGAWAQFDAVPELVARDRQAYIEIVSRLLKDREFYEAACAATREFAVSGMREPDYAAAVAAALTTIVRRVRDASQPAGG